MPFSCNNRRVVRSSRNSANTAPPQAVLVRPPGCLQRFFDSFVFQHDLQVTAGHAGSRPRVIRTAWLPPPSYKAVIDEAARVDEALFRLKLFPEVASRVGFQRDCPLQAVTLVFLTSPLNQSQRSICVQCASETSSTNATNAKTSAGVPMPNE